MAKWRTGLGLFALLLVLNSVLYLVIARVDVPLRLLYPADVVVSILFVSLPIFALYAGANFSWRWAHALGAIAGGVAIQAGLSVLAENTPSAPIVNAAVSFGQAGLILWCMGLGAFIACMLKDRNLILPISVFLALFDVWLVLVPEGLVGQILREHPEQVSKVMYHVPQVGSIAHGGRVADLAYIGPADFVFLAMFFVALYRFQMRTRATFYAIVPVLAAYMLLVLVAGNVHLGSVPLRALPALLPIGAVVLLVNWPEFKLTRDEKLSTLVIGLIAFALVSWRMAIHWHDLAGQAEPLPMEHGQVTLAPPNLPPPAPGGPGAIRRPPSPRGRPSPP